MNHGVRLQDVVAETAAVLRSANRLETETRADAAREARLLISALLDQSPGQLAFALADDQTVSSAIAARVESAVARRARGEPLAYCVGSAPFRDLVLHVDARVLIPRPETEIVVEEVLHRTKARPGGVAVDIGTGSGAIALSLATEGLFDAVIATDVSRDALEVAQANHARIRADVEQRLGVPPMAPVEFRPGADLSPLSAVTSLRTPPAARVQARVIVANPPYIAYGEAAALPPSVRDWEPSVALFAANDGMARYDVLLAEAARFLEPEGWLVLEVDTRRAPATAARARAMGYHNVGLVRDLSKRERVLVAQYLPE